MGLLFSKSVVGFRNDPALDIANKRFDFTDNKFIKRVDLTFQSDGITGTADYPYVKVAELSKQHLPFPAFLLRPLEKHRLPYVATEADAIHFHGQRTVIYIHGSGSVSEDNSILHRLLIQNQCDLIRISYQMDFEKEGIHSPRRAEEMFPFLAEIETKIAPVLQDELIHILTGLVDTYPDLFTNKEVILIAHSLGGGVAANLVVGMKRLKFHKFISLDGTLMNPAIQTGIDSNQLHLSQNQLFKQEWLHEETFTDPRKAIGQDNCKRIKSLQYHSTSDSLWIQVKGSTHFTFTDYPDLFRPSKMIRKYTGDSETAARIRNYVLQFILDPDNLVVDSKDCIIKA